LKSDSLSEAKVSSASISVFRGKLPESSGTTTLLDSSRRQLPEAASWRTIRPLIAWVGWRICDSRSAASRRIRELALTSTVPASSASTGSEASTEMGKLCSTDRLSASLPSSARNSGFFWMTRTRDPTCRNRHSAELVAMVLRSANSPMEPTPLPNPAK
jgi:hypothetical protein